MKPIVHLAVLIAILGVSRISLAQAAPQTADGVPIVHWKSAADYYEREAIVYGRVVMTRNIGKYVFINFDRDYRRHFTLLVKEEHFGSFPEPPERMYDGKLLAARGKVVEYRNKPEIIVSSPEQVAIFPDDTVDVVAAITGRQPASTPPDAPRAVTQSTRVTIATVNLEAVLTVDSSICAAGTGKTTPPTHAEQSAAYVIRSLDADIVAVQQVRDMMCLRRFEKTMLSDLGYDYIVGLANPTTGLLDRGLMSRYPLQLAQAGIASTGEAQLAADTVDQLPLAADVVLPSGDSLRVLVTHLPGAGTSMKMSERLAHVRHVRRFADQVMSTHPHGNLIVCGGFNDHFGSKIVQTLRGSGDTQLIIPGYEPNKGKGVEPPLIARISDFILTSPSAAKRYVSGSTRIEHVEPLPPAVAVALDLAPPLPAAQAMPPATPPGGADGF